MFEDPFPTDDEYEESGIEKNESKSGWVKRRGEWLKPLKFLGMTYDPFKDEFQASTRKGATLEFDESAGFMDFIANNPAVTRNTSSGVSGGLVEYPTNLDQNLHVAYTKWLAAGAKT